MRSRRRFRHAVSLLLVCAFVGLTIGCVGGANGGEVPAATETRTATPSATATETPTSTRTPTSTPLLDRTDCGDVRGKEYRSQTEREWFLSHCVTPAPPPQTVAAPQVPSQLAGPSEPPSTPLPVVGGAVTAIGDSVMLGAASQMRGAISGLDVRATESIQASVAISLISQLRGSGALGSTVIIHIGNNGTFTAGEFNQMMGLLAGVDRVMVINLKVPRSWEGSNNAMLAANVGAYANAVLVDWHGSSAGHPEYFWKDGYHLRPAGAQAYTSLILSYF